MMMMMMMALAILMVDKVWTLCSAGGGAEETISKSSSQCSKVPSLQGDEHQISNGEN